MIQLDTLIFDSAEHHSLDTSNMYTEKDGTSNVPPKQDSILTYQGTTEQPSQPLTSG